MDQGKTWRTMVVSHVGYEDPGLTQCRPSFFQNPDESALALAWLSQCPHPLNLPFLTQVFQYSSVVPLLFGARQAF